MSNTAPHGKAFSPVVFAYGTVCAAFVPHGFGGFAVGLRGVRNFTRRRQMDWRILRTGKLTVAIRWMISLSGVSARFDCLTARGLDAYRVGDEEFEKESVCLWGESKLSA